MRKEIYIIMIIFTGMFIVKAMLNSAMKTGVDSICFEARLEAVTLKSCEKSSYKSINHPHRT